MYALYWIYSTLATIVGFSAISVAVFGTLRARSRYPYVLLIVYYGTFTLELYVLHIARIVFAGGVVPSAKTMIAVHLVDAVLRAAVVAVGALYFHAVFMVPSRRIRDAAIVALSVATIPLSGLVSEVSFATDVSIKLRPLGYVALAMYLALFAYFLSVGFAGSKRDRPRRETVLIWSLLLCASLRFLECCYALYTEWRGFAYRDTYAWGGFYASTGPHILMGVAMIYYFGAYLLADRPYAEGYFSEALITEYGISPREREVVVLMERGLSNREIAERLFISPATVKAHLHNIYGKTGAKSRQRLSHMLRPRP